MFRENLFFQLMLFLICLFSGIYYIVKGKRKEDKKRLIVGVFLLTCGWTEAILLLEHFNLSPMTKNVLNISEVIATTGAMTAAAIYLKKWRPYVIGLGLLLIIIIGKTYISISSGSSNFAFFKTSTKKVY